jgi:phospholipid/cholesterol/gamma-HCH transport system substrate-binding protein
VRLIRRKAGQALALLVVMVVLTACGNWRGIGNVPLPGGPGSGAGSYTIYVQIPNTLALNGNSRVLVADVFVGTVRAITLKNWVATLTIDLERCPAPEERHRQDRADQPLRFSACGAGRAG